MLNLDATDVNNMTVLDYIYELYWGNMSIVCNTNDGTRYNMVTNPNYQAVGPARNILRSEIVKDIFRPYLKYPDSGYKGYNPNQRIETIGDAIRDHLKLMGPENALRYSAASKSAVRFAEAHADDSDDEWVGHYPTRDQNNALMDFSHVTHH